MSFSGVAEYTFDTLTVGQDASFLHTVLQREVDDFARVSGDYSPLHVDAVYASTTPFGKNVVHGMYLGSLVSQLVGMQLPGLYALLASLQIEFKKPTFVGDDLNVAGTIIHKSSAIRMIEIKVKILRSTDLVAEATAHVRLLQ